MRILILTPPPAAAKALAEIAAQPPAPTPPPVTGADAGKPETALTPAKPAAAAPAAAPGPDFVAREFTGDSAFDDAIVALVEAKIAATGKA